VRSSRSGAFGGGGGRCCKSEAAAQRDDSIITPPDSTQPSLPSLRGGVATGVRFGAAALYVGGLALQRLLRFQMFAF
jgi:hypothetical protein